jgi:integrase/recombinase XerD
MIAQTNRIFDTLVDTQKIFVSMKIKFVPRDYTNEDKKAPVYLHITGYGKRKRVHLDIYIDTKKWSFDTQRINFTTGLEHDLNLVLDNYAAKITNIKITFWLSEKVLTPDKLMRELKNNLTRLNFIAYFKFVLDEEKGLMKKVTWKRYNSVYSKLKDWKEEKIEILVSQN